MFFEIPGREEIEITDVLFDYNGTIAVDGQLIDGVAESINELAEDVNFHVITADTFGSVVKALANVNCKVVKIPKGEQDSSKLDYLLKLGKENTLCVGNGKNDKLILKESVIGIALIQDEGACVESLLAADIVCKSVLDVFAFFKVPDRMKATLRN
jgi:soluble P-type ATPase